MLASHNPSTRSLPAVPFGSYLLYAILHLYLPLTELRSQSLLAPLHNFTSSILLAFLSSVSMWSTGLLVFPSGDLRVCLWISLFGQHAEDTTMIMLLQILLDIAFCCVSMHAMPTNYCLLHFFPSHFDFPFPSTVCISLDGHESYISSAVWQKAYFSNSSFSPVATCTVMGLTFWNYDLIRNTNIRCTTALKSNTYCFTSLSTTNTTAKSLVPSSLQLRKMCVISYPLSFCPAILFPVMPLWASLYSFNRDSRHRSAAVLNIVRTFLVPRIFSFPLFSFVSIC